MCLACDAVRPETIDTRHSKNNTNNNIDKVDRIHLLLSIVDKQDKQSVRHCIIALSLPSLRPATRQSGPSVSLHRCSLRHP